MSKKKYVIIVFLTFCLTIAIFIGATTSQYPFDPWFDAYDDGKTNYDDLFYLADRYGTSGTAINKTELLLCLTRGYISVPASAFVPYNNTQRVRIYEILRNDDSKRWGKFCGSVQLPHGATVTNVTSYWFDMGGDDIRCLLTRYNTTGSNLIMANVSSSGSSGKGSTYDDTIDYATIDNSQYAYYFDVWLPPFDGPMWWFFCAIIEWEYPTLP